MSSTISILIPTSNNLANFGSYIECYTLNPNASSQPELEKILAFSYLVGWSIMSRNGLNLDLAPHIWKRLIKG